MLSKKNTQEYMRKTERNHFEFTIRKLSVGVVSVLLGFIFGTGIYANQGLVVHADATSANTATKTASTTSDSRSTSAATTSSASNATSAKTSEASEASAGSSTATSTAASATSSANQTSTANATSAKTSKESEASTSSSVATNKVKVLVTRIAATTNNSALASTTQQAISTTITTRPVNVSEDTAVTSTGNVLQDIYSTDGKYTTMVMATNNSDSTKRVYIDTLLPSYNQLFNVSKYTKAKVGLDTEATPANTLTMNGLTNESVTFSAKAGEYLSYDQYVAKYSWDDLLAIYYQGDLAAGATATATFQTKVVNLSDMQAQMTTVDSGKATQEQAGQAFGNGTLTYSMQDFYYNGSSLVGFATPVSRIYLSEKLSSLAQEIGTTPAAEILTYDGNKTKYIPAPKAIQNVMPEITDSDLTIYYPDGTKADALWYGGSYTIDTASIFNAIKDMGYSVNVNPNGQSNWPVYTYTSYSYENVIVEYPDIKDENGDSAAVQPLYVEVQQVFDTTDKTITTKDDWVPADDLASATLKLKDQQSDSYTNTENLAEDGNYTYTITNNATGAEALSGKGTDAATKLAAGTYTVKYFYTFSDGSAVTKTATLTVLPTDNQINTATYSPKYVKAGDSVTSDVTVTNTETNQTGVPTGTTFALGDGAPEWAQIDATTGEISVKPGADVAANEYDIPVTVTYADNTTDSVTAPIHVVAAPDKVETADVPFDTIYQADPNAKHGSQTMVTQGVTGQTTTTTTYNVDLNTGALVANPATTETTKEKVDKVVNVGTKSTETTAPVDYTTTYVADPNAEAGTKTTVTEGQPGVETTTTTYTLDTKTGEVKAKEPTTAITIPATDKVVAVGTKTKTSTETIPFETVIQEDPTALKGTQTVVTPGKDGSKTTTTTYELDTTTGEVKPTTTTTTTDPTNEVVKVGTATYADLKNPVGQDVTTSVGKVPTAASGIENTGDMPDGTTYTWKDTPDASKPGDTTGTIVVTYPDGTTDKVPVTIHVTSQADGIANKRGLPEGPNYTLKANPDVFEPCATTGTKTMQSNLVDPSASVEETANVTKAPKKTAATKLPQTGDMDKNGVTLFGLALAGVTGLFGGLSLRKKKEDD